MPLLLVSSIAIVIIVGAIGILLISGITVTVVIFEKKLREKEADYSIDKIEAASKKEALEKEIIQELNPEEEKVEE